MVNVLGYLLETSLQWIELCHRCMCPLATDVSRSIFKEGEFMHIL